ncbi:MAG: CRTAC1 family protein [Opitutaceae bacterium]
MKATQSRSTCSTLLTIQVLASCAFLNHTTFAVTTEGANTLFSKAGSSILPLEERSRRKWDSAIVADVDKDGLMDLLLTEHGQRLNVYWNEGGTFSQPQVLVVGDFHGQTVADYDRDGQNEILIYPGGGAGGNPRNPVVYEVDGRTLTEGETFDHFERTRGRVVKLVDIDNNGSLDLLTTGFARQKTDQVKTGANYVFAQSADHGFQFVSKLPYADRMSMRMLATDYNNDGDVDVFTYGGKRIAVGEGAEGQTFTDSTDRVLGDLGKISNASSIVEIDYDNDGDFDLFVTRSEHPFNHKSYHDTDNCCFAFFARFEPMEMDDLKIEGDFVFENLQMAYPHFDVMVGEEKRLLEFQVDRHGHKDFTLKPEESKGWPEDVSAKGLYVGYLGEQMWRMYADTKSPTSGVVHNVISTPSTIPSEDMPAYLLENRDGTFVDVTAEMGITIDEQTTGSAVADFNNDGWSDLFVVRFGSPATKTEQILYLNQGGKGFARADNHGIISEELGSTGMAAEVFDYDMDGDTDIIYCNERGRWHLHTNEHKSADSNYVVVKVGDSPSGEALAMGAMLTIEAGDYIYKRYVGQTASSFGQSTNYYLHVGLGAIEKVDSAVIRWSNGEEEAVEINSLNHVVSVGSF